MDIDHTITALSYVELNPVRATMCKYGWEYSWSSAAAHCGIREDRILDLEKWFRNYRADEWMLALQSAAERKGYVEEIREHTRNGQPLGRKEYFQQYGWS
jgi:putative transposase